MAKKIMIGIVVSRFNGSITSKMEAAARKEAKKLGAVVAEIAYSPGALDSPFVALQMLKRGKVDCIAVLGAAVKGETGHDAVVVNTAASSLSALSLSFGKPIGFGVIGPNATKKQAEARAAEYAKGAVGAAIFLAAGKISTVREHK